MEDFCFNIFTLDHYRGPIPGWQVPIMIFCMLGELVFSFVLSSEYLIEDIYAKERKKKGHRNVKKRKTFWERAWYTNLFLIGGDAKIPFRFYVYRYVPIISFVLSLIGLIINQIINVHWAQDLYLLFLGLLHYFFLFFLTTRAIILNLIKNKGILKAILILIALALCCVAKVLIEVYL